jgi:hypothetical protein
MTQEEANTKLSEIKQIQNERQEKFYSWVKTLITLSVGLFGILISFKSDLPMSYVKSIFFIVSLSSLGFGIFFAVIVLFSEVHILDRLKNNRIQSVIKQLDGKNVNIDFEEVKASFFYRLSNFLCLCFYLISLFSLIGYSTFDLIKNLW